VLLAHLSGIEPMGRVAAVAAKPHHGSDELVKKKLALSRNRI